MKSVCLWVFPFVGLLALVAEADSIRVGDNLYEDVYVGTSSGFYYIHFPDEGRVEKVSRVRRDVETPTIDADSKARAELKARYDAKKAENEQRRDEAENTVLHADKADFDRRKALEYFGLLELQRAYWIDLSDAQQQMILDGVLNVFSNAAGQYATEAATISQRLENLNETRSDREFELSVAKSRRDAEIADAGRDNASDIFMEEYEKSLLRHSMGNSRYVSEHWREAAETEDAYEAHRIRRADANYKRESSGVKQEIAQVDEAITRKEREVIATQNKAASAERRYSSYLARIDQLIELTHTSHELPVFIEPIERWGGEKDLRTQPLEVEAEVWVVEVERADFGVESDLGLVVVDAETDLPVTAITKKDFLHMRTLVMDRPGKFYFKVEQDGSGIPYELRVSQVIQNGAN